MADEEVKRISLTDLANFMDEFVRQHSHSRDVEMRWISAYLDEGAASMVMRIKFNNLDEKERKLMAAFRLSEIEKEKADKQREIDTLEREALKLSA